MFHFEWASQTKPKLCFPLLLHIIDGDHAAILMTFQDDQRGGNFLAGLGENTGIVPGVLCDGALDTQARHH